MRKGKQILFLVFALTVMMKGVNAECDYETQVKLATEASNVKTNYEVKDIVINWQTGEEVTGVTEDEVDDDDSVYVREKKIMVSLYNITSNMIVTITNGDGMNEEITYEETNNGTYTFDGGYLENIINYDIKITTNNPSCSGDELRTLNLQTPKINDYHYLTACEGVDDYYCQEFIDFDLNMSEDEIISKALLKRDGQTSDNQNTDENKSWFDNVKEYLKKHQWIVFTTIGGIILIAGVATTVIIIKKRRSKVL